METLIIKFPLGIKKKDFLEQVAIANNYQAKIPSERLTVIKATIEEVRDFSKTVHEFETYAPRADGKYDVYYKNLINNVPKHKLGENIILAMIQNLGITVHEKNADITKKTEDFIKAEKKKIKDTFPIKDITIE